jgi:hypothetical protein
MGAESMLMKTEQNGAHVKEEFITLLRRVLRLDVKQGV